MKKLLKIAVMLICFFPSFSFALEEEEQQPTENHDVYLENLTIEGYNFTPEFDKYNNIYTLIIDSEIGELVINAIPEESDTDILIEGNKNLVVGENEIFITIQNDSLNAENVYKLIVTIKDDTLTTGIVIDDKSKELNLKEVSTKDVAIILTVCSLVILFFFYIMFLKKKKV